MSSPTQNPSAVIAAHRFGLGEARLDGVGNDPQGWLLAQIGPADAQVGDRLPTAYEGVRRFAEIFAERRRRIAANTKDEAELRSAEAQYNESLRQLAQNDVRARLVTAATTQRPFAERLTLFWANHFTISLVKGNTRGLVGAFEREAIRPHIAGSFEQMLVAATTHAGMLRYLDNEVSTGPNSRLAQQRQRRPQMDDSGIVRRVGLNENLAREVLELHTLGVDGGYKQADVTAFAAVLTGWRVPVQQITTGALPASEAPGRFDAFWHEPGGKQLLGKRYGEGSGALLEALHDLAEHPSTARFIATKLARHFVADDPPPALVARLAARFSETHGDLPSVYRELVQAPEAWAATATKLKTPEEFVVSTARTLGLREQAFPPRIADGGTGVMGQRVQAAPSPAGWPDRAEEWLGPDAVWKRVEWATRVADRMGRQLDARQVARNSFGDTLSEATTRQIERATDGPQALALLLLAPEFQRR